MSPLGIGIGAGMNRAAEDAVKAIASFGVGAVVLGVLGKRCMGRADNAFEKALIATVTVSGILASPFIIPPACKAIRQLSSITWKRLGL